VVKLPSKARSSSTMDLVPFLSVLSLPLCVYRPIHALLFCARTICGKRLDRRTHTTKVFRDQPIRAEQDLHI
jgi:hypothetical protein